MTRAIEVDLTDPRLYANGFPREVFTELRRRGPVHRHPAVEGRLGVSSAEFWSIVSHPEIQRANHDHPELVDAGANRAARHPRAVRRTRLGRPPIVSGRRRGASLVDPGAAVRPSRYRRRDVVGAIASGYRIELMGLPVWAGAGPPHNVGIGIDSLPVRGTRER